MKCKIESLCNAVGRNFSERKFLSGWSIIHPHINMILELCDREKYENSVVLKEKFYSQFTADAVMKAADEKKRIWTERGYDFSWG